MLELNETVLASQYERRDPINGIPTFSRTLGLGEDVVLVHGVGVSSEYWRPAQRELAATGRYRVHAVDLPGFGRSSEPPWPPELPRLAEHLHAWIERHIPGRFHLVGQSMGCDLCVLYAAAWPENIDRLVLAGPAGLPTLRSLTVQIAQAALDAPRESLALFGAITPDYLRAGVLKILRMLAEQKRYHAGEVLEKIRKPTLVLRGDRDTVVSRERVEAVMNALPFGEAATLPGAHAFHFSHAEEFARAVGGFLRG